MVTANCRNPVIVYLCSFLFFAHFFCLVSQAANTIKRGQVIRDGEYVVSAGQVFALGFFSPMNSASRYVGIWYHNLPSDAVVWVANRERPISGRNGVLTFGSNGNLMVSDGNENTVWSANVSTVANSSTAILEDSGNLVLSRSEDTAEVYWQSFKNATDTFLPGMKVRNGDNQLFYSWKTANDPSLGNYSMGIDHRGSPQVVIWEHSNRHWRSGHWDGRIFSGVTKMNFFYLYGFKYSIEGEYFTYNVSNNSTLLRFWLRWDGMVRQLRWDGNARNWSEILSLPENQCGVYNICGNFGSCSIMNSPICSCIDGFERKNKDRWDMGYWSDGCFRRTQLQCERNESTTGKGGRDKFLAIGKVKLPDFADRVDIQDKKLCEAECLKNCSCTAYAHVSGLNCMLWSGDLIDIEEFADGGNTLYVRLADSDLESKGISNVIVTIIALAGAGFLSFFGWLLWKFNKDLKVFFNVSGNYPPAFDVSATREFPEQISRTASLLGEGKQASGQDLLMFNFSYVAAATSYFSIANKLGQGGFGPVYKGKLPGGEEVAVKRLSKMSGQGMEEFKNEIILISKLQHRNLVRLLGCCIKGEEKMLIYEYMPNKSLDSFLFEPTKRAQLDWGKRVAIIEGIARGLLYLHRDSRLRIIHRDLKASNILLDQEMNPKISDFGMARIFGGIKMSGYMSPEYAMEGLFSVKSDVYSFGVLLLEILSGQRNVSFRWQGHSGLIGYAWQLWKEGREMEFIDASLSGSCPENEVMRCMHVGMLCVQDSASSRPTISSLLLMLDSNSAANLPIPKQPTFTSMRSSVDVDSWEECRDDIASSNDVTFTAILGR